MHKAVLGVLESSFLMQRAFKWLSGLPKNFPFTSLNCGSLSEAMLLLKFS